MPLTGDDRPSGRMLTACPVRIFDNELIGTDTVSVVAPVPTTVIDDEVVAVSPTVSPTAEIVPLIGARSTALATLSFACFNVATACLTDTSSESIVASVTVPPLLAPTRPLSAFAFGAWLAETDARAVLAGVWLAGAWLADAWVWLVPAVCDGLPLVPGRRVSCPDPVEAEGFVTDVGGWVVA